MKKIVAIFMTMVILTISTITVLAKEYNVTKTKTTYDQCVDVTLSYTSFKNSNGVKLVKNGKITNVKLSSLYKYGGWGYICQSKKLKYLDAGRTYQVSVEGKLVSKYLTKSQSSSAEFYYATK